MQGDYDWNIPVEEAHAYNTKLAMADHPDAQVTILNDLSHAFNRIAEPDWTKIEAEDIGDRVDPVAIDKLIKWLKR